jgi:predicted DNA-binding transcriptional regulator YafY
MNRTDRLVGMVMFLQGRRVVKAEDLARHFGVTVRTIYRDVAALGEAGVPIVGEAGVGYSLVKGYHLPPVMFTAEEAIALFTGGEMVKQFADASIAGAMSSALLRIRSVLSRERQDELDRLAQATAIGGASRTVGDPDQRVLLPLQQAILARRVVGLSYRASGRPDDSVRDVEPLGILFHRGAWYLVGWCRLRRDYRHFRIDRMRQVGVKSERFAARPDFSLREHLLEASGEQETVAARVWFADAARERVRREHHAGAVEERRRGNGAEFALTTVSLDWLARWLLSFGPDAEALAPAELRRKVRAEAERIAARHRKPRP